MVRQIRTRIYLIANGNVIEKKNNSPAPEDTGNKWGDHTGDFCGPDDGTDESGEDGWDDADSDTVTTAQYGKLIDNDYEAASYAENSETGEATFFY